MIVDDSGATLSITTSASFGNLLEVDAGVINFNSVNASIASFEQTGGTVGGAGTLTVSGAATFGGSSFDQAEGTGTTLLEGATTDTGAIDLDGGHVLANAGTFDVTGSATFYLGYKPTDRSVGSGTIQNDSGGTFDFQTASAVYNDSRHERVRERGHAGADGHHGDDRHRRDGHQHRHGVGARPGRWSSAAAARPRRENSRWRAGPRSISAAARSRYRAAPTTRPGRPRFPAARRISPGLRSRASARWTSRAVRSRSRIREPPPRSTQTGGTIGGAGTLTVSGAATFGGSSYDQAEGTGTTSARGVTTDDSALIALDGGMCWRTRARST